MIFHHSLTQIKETVNRLSDNGGNYASCPIYFSLSDARKASADHLVQLALIAAAAAAVGTAAAAASVATVVAAETAAEAVTKSTAATAAVTGTAG